MSLGIANQSLVSVRREPSESSEMVNQILFGETFTIVETYNSWIKILSSYDFYEGWLDSKLVEVLAEEQFINDKKNELIASNLFTAKRDSSPYPLKLCPGSSIYNFRNGSFKVGSTMYNTLNVQSAGITSSVNENIIKISEQFINSPYLWGGRSPYGIDCSGLVQIVYKIVGIKIPRDSSQQVKVGEAVDFINMVKPGDLAFFDNEEGIVTHVGILAGNGKIIHSSGHVRIDSLDHQGIFNAEQQKYTHKLRVIKRIIPT